MVTMADVPPIKRYTSLCTLALRGSAKRLPSKGGLLGMMAGVQAVASHAAEIPPTCEADL